MEEEEEEREMAIIDLIIIIIIRIEDLINRDNMDLEEGEEEDSDLEERDIKNIQSIKINNSLLDYILEYYLLLIKNLMRIN